MANHPSSDPKIQEIVRDARSEQKERVKAQNSSKPKGKGNKGSKGKSKGKKSQSIWSILFD